MVEKKSHMSTRNKILILVLSGIGLFSFLILFRFLSTNPLAALIESWIIVESRWNYGNIEILKELTEHPVYALELLWDTHYRHARIDQAILAYREALGIESNSIIELKLALLTTEKTHSGTWATSTWVSSDIMKETFTRIEKDGSNRAKYFGTSEEYTRDYPLFETRDEEIIDW